MDREEKIEFIENIFRSNNTEHGNLSEMFYTASELGVLDDLNIEPELAVKIWKLVEFVRNNEFPRDLQM